jgi:outer membrane protein
VRHAASWLAAAALAPSFLLALAACRGDGEKDAQEFRKILDATVPPAEDPAADEPLTLARAMAVANQKDERLGSTGEEYVQSLLQKNRIVANFLPTISFQPTYIIGDRPPGATTGVNESLNGIFVKRGGTLQQFEAPVVGSMNLFNGGGDVASLKSIESTIVARRELLLDLQATVMLNVAQAFYAVLRAERSVQVLTHSLEVEEARLADVSARQSQGLATALAVAQTRAQVDSTRADLVTARADVENGRHALALVVGVAAVAQPLVDTLAVPDDVGPETDFERRALEGRADLKAARAAIESADHDVDAAVAQYYPSISLDVTGFLYRESFADASKWNALLSANLPIFSAGRIEADVRLAWSRLRQAALDESAARRHALFDVQVAFENLAASRRRIQELEDQVSAAAEARDRAVDARANGLGIELDVLLAQEALQNAELALTDARFDRSVFFLALQRATGELPQGG